MRIIGVPSHRIMEWWTKVKPWVQSAVEYSDEKMSTIDIFQLLVGQDAQLWLAVDTENRVKGLFVSEIVQHPNGKACCVIICTGEDAHEWYGFLEHIEMWAKNEGCQWMELRARPGWKKLLKSYRQTHIFLEKRL